MIDVDIIGQLVPNPLTMVVQLCSTLVLFFLMKKFLWKSVKEFMTARSDKMQEDLNASEVAKEAALLDRNRAKEELQQASERSEEIVNAAVKEAKNEKESILAQANKEADAARKKASEQIVIEREEMYRSMQKEMVEVALAAAIKLLEEENGEDLDREAIDAFVKEATENAE